MPSEQHPNVLSAPTSGPQAELHSEPTQTKTTNDLKQREEKKVEKVGDFMSERKNYLPQEVKMSRVS